MSQPNRMAVHYSSRSDDWSTPQFLFDGLNAEFRFELDVCATAANAKCRRYFAAEDDGLRQAWAPSCCWMNPPYGRRVGRWVEKAFEEARLGATVVCLLPARTDTTWWHRWATRGEVRFLRGRLKFGGAKHAAPFPSAVVIFRPPGSDGRHPRPQSGAPSV